jgi:hypothetical protein
MNAMTALNQLTNSNNGINRLSVMIGAKHFAQSKEQNYVGFRFAAKAKNKANYCKISLNGLDLYDVTFMSIRGANVKTVETHENIYNDMLKRVFEQSTGLYLSL